MVEIGRPVKDIEIDSNTSIEKIFEEFRGAFAEEAGSCRDEGGKE